MFPWGLVGMQPQWISLAVSVMNIQWCTPTTGRMGWRAYRRNWHFRARLTSKFQVWGERSWVTGSKDGSRKSEAGRKRVLLMAQLPSGLTSPSLAIPQGSLVLMMKPTAYSAVDPRPKDSSLRGRWGEYVCVVDGFRRSEETTLCSWEVLHKLSFPSRTTMSLYDNVNSLRELWQQIKPVTTSNLKNSAASCQNTSK